MDHLLTSYFKRSLSNVKQPGENIKGFKKILLFLLLLYDENADFFMDKHGINTTVKNLTSILDEGSVLLLRLKGEKKIQ